MQFGVVMLLLIMVTISILQRKYPKAFDNANAKLVNFLLIASIFCSILALLALFLKNIWLIYLSNAISLLILIFNIVYVIRFKADKKRKHTEQVETNKEDKKNL